MAQDWQAFPSGIPSNGINSVGRTLVDEPESIGRPGEAPATDVTVENSAFALLAGICVGLGLTTGAVADTNNSERLFNDPLVTLGTPEDDAAADTGAHSAIAFMKGILVSAGLS